MLIQHDCEVASKLFFAKVFDLGSRVFRFISGEMKVILNSQSSIMVLSH